MFSTPAGGYRLEYSVDVFGPNSGPKIGDGSFTVTEGHGHLLVEIQLAGEETTLEYETGRSLLIRSPKDRSTDWFESHPTMYSDGLEYLSTGLPLYLPFQFHSVNVYSSIDGFLKVLKEAKSTVAPEVYRAYSDLGPSNVSIRGRSGLSEGGLLPGYFRTDRRSSILTAGTPSQKSFDFVYSDFKDMLGIRVPGRIEMIAYLSVYSTKLHRPLEPKETKRYVIKVKKLTPNSASLQGFRKESLLAKGMWINYSGRQGKGAGVLFDPAKGSLDEQLGLQLSIRNKAVAVVDRRPDVPLVPIIVAFLLGLGSLVCLIGGRSKRSKR